MGFFALLVEQSQGSCYLTIGGQCCDGGACDCEDGSSFTGVLTSNGVTCYQYSNGVDRSAFGCNEPTTTACSSSNEDDGDGTSGEQTTTKTTTTDSGLDLWVWILIAIGVCCCIAAPLAFACCLLCSKKEGRERSAPAAAAVQETV